MIEPLARLGYASKAVIYAIVGYLAIAAATNRGGRITDTSGALRVVLGQPFGRILLVVLALGLCGYALWRILDAIVDPDRDGTGFGGLVTRIGNVVRGLVYGALGIEAFNLFRGLGGSNGQEARTWTMRIMDFPLGVWLVGLGGAIIAIYGIAQIVASAKGYEKSVDVSAIPSQYRTLLTRVARFGIAARGAILTVLGFFLLRAAISRDPSEAHGVRESTLELAIVVEGRWMLGIVAAGLLAYAVDQALHARYRRIRPPV
jgi:hypothetical protein